MFKGFGFLNVDNSLAGFFEWRTAPPNELEWMRWDEMRWWVLQFSRMCASEQAQVARHHRSDYSKGGNNMDAANRPWIALKWIHGIRWGVHECLHHLFFFKKKVNQSRTSFSFTHIFQIGPSVRAYLKTDFGGRALDRVGIRLGPWPWSRSKLFSPGVQNARLVWSLPSGILTIFYFFYCPSLIDLFELVSINRSPTQLSLLLLS